MSHARIDSGRCVTHIPGGAAMGRWAPDSGQCSWRFLFQLGAPLMATTTVSAEVTTTHRKQFQKLCAKLHEEMGHGMTEETLPPSDEGLGTRNWGDALDRYGVGGYMGALVDASVLADILSGLRQVPQLPWHSTETSQYLILEARLNENISQVDYSLGLNERMMYAQLAVDARVRAWAKTSPQWRLVLDYLERAPKKYASELWLEFDQPTGPSAPSVFVAAPSWLRRVLTAKSLSQVLKPKVTSEEATELLEPLLRSIWSPFWSAKPSINSTQHQVRSKLAQIIVEAREHIELYQVGFWLARDTGALRLILQFNMIYNEPQLYFDTKEWWRRTALDLKRIGYSWTDEARPGLLEDLMPKLLIGPSFFNVALDLTASGLSPKIGFEMFFDETLISDAREKLQDQGRDKRGLDSYSNQTAFLMRLNELGLCSEEKMQAAIQAAKSGWQSVSYLKSTSNVHIFVNHIKVVFEPGKPVEAKIYTCTRWVLKKHEAKDEL